MRLPGVLSKCFCHLVTGKTHCLSQGQRLRSKPSTGCHLRLNLSRQYPWKSSLLAGPPPSTPPPPEPILQLCGGLGPSPGGLLLGTRVPTQGNRWARDVLSLEKRDFIAAVSTYKQTHPPRFPPVGKTKRRAGM